MIILLAGASTSFSQSQGPFPTPPGEHKKSSIQTEAHKTPVQTFQQLPNNPISTIKPRTSEEQKNTKIPKKEREDNTTTDWWLIGFTGVIALFTCVLAIVGYIQAKILYRQTLYFQRTERAYVFVTLNDTENNFIPEEPPENSPYDIYRIPRTKDPAIRSVELWNEGKTPAILTRINVDTQLFSIKDYPNEKHIIESPEIPSGGIIIQSGKKFAFTAPISISFDQWKEIEAEKLRLVCYGRIEYKDVLGNSHKTGFCWEYIKKNGCFNSSYNTTLNYYT
jgi:hypothetical protein